MSTRPNSDSALAASVSTSAFLPTSASTGTALTPRSRASRATASASCRLERALTTTCAPSRASFSTVARPILRPDPVTSATFPSSLPMPLSLLPCLHRTPHRLTRHRQSRQDGGQRCRISSVWPCIEQCNRLVCRAHIAEDDGDRGEGRVVLFVGRL